MDYPSWSKLQKRGHTFQLSDCQPTPCRSIYQRNIGQRDGEPFIFHGRHESALRANRLKFSHQELLLHGFLSLSPFSCLSTIYNKVSELTGNFMAVSFDESSFSSLAILPGIFLAIHCRLLIHFRPPRTVIYSITCVHYMLRYIYSDDE